MMSIIISLLLLAAACGSTPEVTHVETNGQENQGADQDGSDEEDGSNASVTDEQGLFDGKTNLTVQEQLALDFARAFYVDDEQAREEAIYEYVHDDNVDFFLFFSGLAGWNESFELRNIAIVDSVEVEEGMLILAHTQIADSLPGESIFIIEGEKVALVLAGRQEDQEFKELYDELRAEFAIEPHPEMIAAAKDNERTADSAGDSQQDAEPELGSRRNPAQTGDAFIINFDDWFYGRAEMRVQLLEVIAGDEAWEMVRQANQFNDRPGDGKMYILARFSLEAISLEEEPFQVHHLLFDYVTGGGTFYDDFVSVAGLEPSIQSELYEGARHEGWTYFLVDEDDDSPFAVFDRTNADVWFLLK